MPYHPIPRIAVPASAPDATGTLEYLDDDGVAEADLDALIPRQE